MFMNLKILIKGEYTYQQKFEKTCSLTIIVMIKFFHIQLNRFK